MPGEKNGNKPPFDVIAGGKTDKTDEKEPEERPTSTDEDKERDEQQKELIRARLKKEKKRKPTKAEVEQAHSDLLDQKSRVRLIDDPNTSPLLKATLESAKRGAAKETIIGTKEILLLIGEEMKLKLAEREEKVVDIQTQKELAGRIRETAREVIKRRMIVPIQEIPEEMIDQLIAECYALFAQGIETASDPDEKK